MSIIFFRKKLFKNDNCQFQWKFANQAQNCKFIKYNCDIIIYFKLKTYSKTCNMFKKKMIKVNQNIKTQITKTFFKI